MKNILTVALLIILSLCSCSDNRRDTFDSDQRGKIEAMRIGYITEQVKLTSEQSVVFWPLYNEYSCAIHDLYEERRVLYQNMKDGDHSLENLEQWFSFDGKIVEVKRVYVVKFSDVISPEQVVKVFLAEDGFKRELVRMYRK